MAEEYSKALRVLMKSPVTDSMIRFLTNTTLKVLPMNQATTTIPTPPASPLQEQDNRLPSLRSFITRLVRYTNVYTPTLLATVCYLNKLKRILPKDATGLPSTIHRMFLACLILSAKQHNDSSPLNKHWAEYTDGLFSLEDINLMERQLLALLDWDLRLTENDLILDLRYLLEPIMKDIQTSNQQRRLLKAKKSSAGTSSLHSNPLYHSKSESVGSNLSSATLIENESSLSLPKYSRQYYYGMGSRSSSTSTLHETQVSKSPTNGQEWDFEQLMVQHGF